MILNANWKIESDNYDVILKKRHRDKHGEDVWSCEGYYSDLKQALIGFVNLNIKATGLKDIQEVQQEIDKLYEAINAIKCL